MRCFWYCSCFLNTPMSFKEPAFYSREVIIRTSPFSSGHRCCWIYSMCVRVWFVYGIFMFMAFLCGISLWFVLDMTWCIPAKKKSTFRDVSVWGLWASILVRERIFLSACLFYEISSKETFGISNRRSHSLGKERE